MRRFNCDTYVRDTFRGRAFKVRGALNGSAYGLGHTEFVLE